MYWKSLQKIFIASGSISFMGYPLQLWYNPEGMLFVRSCDALVVDYDFYILKCIKKGKNYELLMSALPEKPNRLSTNN